MRRARFRFDASRSLGSGHAYRCLTLARALAEAGWSVDVAVGRDTAAIVPLDDFPVVQVSGNATAEMEAAAIGQAGEVDLLVVDHYDRDARFESACRTWAKRVFVIDDLADRPHDCDLLLDQSLGRSAADYAAFVHPSCHSLLGPDYALLRPQFAAARFLRTGPSRGGLRRIVVSLGGTDPHRLTTRVLHGILCAGVDCDVDVITGLAVPVNDLPKSPGFHLHQNVNDMASLLSDADLAIGAGGISSWERTCLGLPTALVVTADNQRLVADRLVSIGAAVSLGDWATLTEERIATTLDVLHGSPERLAAMRQTAAQVCDGLGVGRVLCAIDPIVLDSGIEIELRKVRDEDCDNIFAWQNEPGARIYSRNPEPPSADDHRTWFAAKRRDPQGGLDIVLVDGIPAGLVRLDRVKNGNHLEVSVLVSRGFRKLGVGTAALLLLGRLAPWADLVAEIHPDNLSSRKAFERAGYLRTDDRHFYLPRRSRGTA